MAAPDSHPNFYDFHIVEENMMRSQTFALWAIAAELNELNEQLSDGGGQ